MDRLIVGRKINFRRLCYTGRFLEQGKMLCHEWQSPMMVRVNKNWNPAGTTDCPQCYNNARGTIMHKKSRNVTVVKEITTTDQGESRKHIWRGVSFWDDPIVIWCPGWWGSSWRRAPEQQFFIHNLQTCSQHLWIGWRRLLWSQRVPLKRIQSLLGVYTDLYWWNPSFSHLSQRRDMAGCPAPWDESGGFLEIVPVHPDVLPWRDSSMR